MISENQLRKYANLIVVDVQIHIEIVLDDKRSESLVNSMVIDLKHAVGNCDFAVRAFKEYQKTNNGIRL